MRRREFITLLGGAATAWPLAARAQQPDQVRRIGVFTSGAESDPSAQAYVRALRQGLEKLGWIEGRNIRADYRWASGDVNRLRADAAEMVDLTPDVILCGGTQLTEILRQKTGAIPIVFVHVADPIAGGLVQSLARPDDNITGFTAYDSSISEKWLEVLKKIAPRLSAGRVQSVAQMALARRAVVFQARLIVACRQSRAEAASKAYQRLLRHRGALMRQPNLFAILPRSVSSQLENRKSLN